MLYDADTGDLIDFAKRWADLGEAITEQVARVVDNSDTDEVNPDAIEMAWERLLGMNEGLDHALGGYLSQQDEFTSDPPRPRAWDAATGPDLAAGKGNHPLAGPTSSKGRREPRPVQGPPDYDLDREENG